MALTRINKSPCARLVDIQTLNPAFLRLFHLLPFSISPVMVLRMHTPFDSGFDALVHQELARCKVPGVSVAVVHRENTFSKVWPLQGCAVISTYQSGIRDGRIPR